LFTVFLHSRKWPYFFYLLYFREQPYASCLHTRTFVTKQYKLVPVKCGNTLQLGR